MLQIRVALLLGLSVLVPLSQSAQADPGARWYKVELIAFERLDSQSLASEVWPVDPGQPDWHNAVQLKPSGKAAPVAFERLGRKDYSLGPHLWSLSRARSGVRPLIHRAWVQPIGSARGATAVYLHSSGSVDKDKAASPDAGVDSGPAARMEGTITLSRSRFLHVHVDLLLRRPGPPSDNGLPGMPTYRLQANRRMRVGELHYIDHPAMGLIIKVARLGPSADDEPPDEGSDPAGGT